jgi:hypothetical protein
LAKIYLVEDGDTTFVNVSTHNGDTAVAYFQDKKLFLHYLDDKGKKVVENFLETEDRYIKVGQ